MVGQGADPDGQSPEHHLLCLLVASAPSSLISNASNIETKYQLWFVPFASSEVTLSLSPSANAIK